MGWRMAMWRGVFAGALPVRAIVAPGVVLLRRVAWTSRVLQKCVTFHGSLKNYVAKRRIPAP